ncbi:MAG: carbohydrate ABC transporter permease [Acidimicrobiia bacterium]
MTRAEFEEKFFGGLKWLSVAFFLIITAFPLLYMIALSFKPLSELLRDPGAFLPSWRDITGMTTYREVLRPRSQGGQGFGIYIRNSFTVAMTATFFTTVIAIFGAYATARLKFAGRKAMTWGILVVYLFPGIVIAIPLFVVFTRLSLRDSLWGLVIVYVAQTIPVALYMLRSYFITIPVELEEAGLIDGLGRMGVIRRVTLPLSAPAIAAVALFVFMIAWNEFLFALLFLSAEPDLWTLSLGVNQLDTTEVPKTVLMAGSVIITVPVIILFFAAERFLTEGLTAGGVKG